MNKLSNVYDYARELADKFGVESQDPRIVNAIAQAYFDGVYDEINRPR